MLERLVADVLVRVLGQYLVGITPSTVSLGVWGGNLDLHKLAVRPDALAVLLETLGLDLPVTCIAGSVGSLQLRVPWKALRSQPVVLVIRDLVVVASPVSDGDQVALELRDARLKAARLEADDALREARFSVRAATARLTRWRQRFTSSLVATVVGNIQVAVENVIVQYQDASSVRDRPYTVTLAVDSMRSASTDASFNESFSSEGADNAEGSAMSGGGAADGSGIVYKVLHLDGLVANWVPGIGDKSHETLEAATWAAAVRACTDRRVIHPMSGRFRIALVSDAAAASFVTPKAELDLCFPEVQLAFDDFQYHTLLSTIMYLSDIDRKVRPKSSRGRWLWALERLLPRFKERHEARLRFNAEGLRERREQRELYVRARKAVVRAKMNNTDLDLVATEVSVLRDMELLLSLADALLFRDTADRELAGEPMMTPAKAAASTSRLWRSIGGNGAEADNGNDDVSDKMQGPSLADADATFSAEVDCASRSGSRLGPAMRMAFLLGRGSIQLSRGGFPDLPVGISRLVFHELRVGVTTWADGGGLLLEALLGTLDVLDLQSLGHTKVLYPRVEWAGQGNTSVAGDTRSYPEGISVALDQIRGSYEKSDSSLFRPTETGLETPVSLFSHGSVSRTSFQSDGSGSCGAKPEDNLAAQAEALDYLVALRLQQEDSATASQSGGKVGTRLTMDLAIGGMEAVVDGPNGSFVSSISFWHPREKLPSIMQFLGRAAAPRLASLRMDLQRMLMDRKAPMRIDMLIRGPRFVVPGPEHSGVSLILDLGTFAMETFDGLPVMQRPHADNGSVTSSMRAKNESSADVRCTDYRMTGSDLGVFIVSAAEKRAAERLVRPFSLRVLLQVLNDASYIEAIMEHAGLPAYSKVRMFGRLSSVRTTISHGAFRNLLKVAHQWSEWTGVSSHPSGIEPNSPRITSTALLSNISVPVFPPLDEEKRYISPESIVHRPRLTSFDMRLELDNLLLELRDSSARRVVTLSSEGTEVKLVRRPSKVEVDFRVRAFVVEDGSRGATAPFRRLLYAGLQSDFEVSLQAEGTGSASKNQACGEDAFVHVQYIDDTVRREQEIVVKVVSLSMVCVRETYLALADFFYRSDEISEETFVDPFVSVGMTTSEAVLALRNQAGRGVELSKRALAQRGELRVSAILDGIDVTLVAAEGAIASFELRQCAVRLRQAATGDVHASGNFESLTLRDLTAAFDIHSQAMTYTRDVTGKTKNASGLGDGWTLDLPVNGETWLRSRLTNIRIVYVQRFVVVLKQYLNALRDELQPVLSLKGGLAEVFESETQDSWKTVSGVTDKRLRLDVFTKGVDIIMPRHSQSPHEALRFFVATSSVTNDEPAAPGYLIGILFSASDVSSYVLYTPPQEGVSSVESLQFTHRDKLVPFSTGMAIAGKLDMWRTRRVPRVVLNADGNPVLKDGELERDYDPQEWLPALRARLCAPSGLSARLCEAEYSILYFAFTENIIERPEIEFTDIVRGLKTPILPPRLPVQPIMLSSNRMPPNYSIVFDLPSISSVIQSGSSPLSSSARLVGTELRGVSGRFDYGVDFRMSLEIAVDVKEVTDLRPGVTRDSTFALGRPQKDVSPEQREQTITLNWDRPFGHRANIMLVVSALRIIVVPELFRDLGMLTAPGFPYLESSAPAPFVRFNGRLLIVTLSNPEIWLMAEEFEGDGRGFVAQGDVIAKVQWAAVTGRVLVEVASKGLRASLCHSHVENGFPNLEKRTGSISILTAPLIYPLDVSCKFHAGGYDPAPNRLDLPIQKPGSTLTVNAESLLARVDVKDTPTLLAIGSRIALLPPSELSRRSPVPGRFDEWKDAVEEGDAKLSVHFALPHARILFTDEVAGRHVPIMEFRARDTLLRSNVPWLTNARVEVSIDLFNELKGWWEPGIEKFPVEVTTSQGRSGSIAINARANESIDINITPSTVSGAARVAKSIKNAVEGLHARLRGDDDGSRGEFMDIASVHVSEGNEDGCGSKVLASRTKKPVVLTRGVPKRTVEPSSGGRRPSVAAFCVQNHSGRPASVWQAHVSTRWHLKGDGGEIEMDMPTDQVMWSVLVDGDGAVTDANQNRHALMRCTIAMSGYRPVSLSAAEVGVECINMLPERSNFENLPRRTAGNASLQVVWDVSMRDGVPVACLRSIVRLLNKTGTVLEIGIGDLDGSALLSSSTIALDDVSGSSMNSNSPAYSAILPARETLCVPVHSVDRTIRIRPALFSAPDIEEESGRDESRRIPGEPRKQNVPYTYDWSKPLSGVDAMRRLGRASFELTDRKAATLPLMPVLACNSIRKGLSFCFTITPIMSQARSLETSGAASFSEGWVDLELQAPIVIENCLPRPLAYAVADSQLASVSESDAILTRGVVEPLRQSHIHTAGGDLGSLALGLGYENLPARSSEQTSSSLARAPTAIISFHTDISQLHSVPLGSHRVSSLTLRLDQGESHGCRKIAVHADYWLQNRSDVDLFFKDVQAGVRGDGSTASDGRPKTLLRGCSQGQRADPFVCFSGSWLSFQRCDATEDVWVHVAQEVSDIDKPLVLGFQGLGLSLDVRPARGKFSRSFVATVRNTGWIQNCTSYCLQWCQSAALSARGIVLSSHVHTLEPWKTAPLHWEFLKEEKAVCIRRVDADGSSTWMWSRPVAIEGGEGEFAAKMYRPKRHEQYIARAVVTSLKAGVHVIAVHPEDRNTPPYRIVNRTGTRSIAFRQTGAVETHPWLVRPGKATRYSWDDPRAPLKRRSLLIEVIEPRDGPSRSSSVASLSSISNTRESDELASMANSLSGRVERVSSEVRRLKFELSIDVVTEEVPIPFAAKLNPALSVSVCVDGPTKVVTFSDKGPAPPQSGQIPICSREGSGQDNWRARPECASGFEDNEQERSSVNVDIEVYIKSVGISLIDKSPCELVFMNISDILFRLDRFESSELLMCEVMDVQIDNQLPRATWPVLMWSPSRQSSKVSSSLEGHPRQIRKPFFQLIMDGKYPRYSMGISRFRGVFLALQHVEFAADKDCVLRLLIFGQDILEASGEAEFSGNEDIGSSRIDDVQLESSKKIFLRSREPESGPVLVRRLYVEQLELCPLKLTVSFASTRSPLSEHVLGYRNLIRTLMAIFGNVDKAEFRFNALELRHVFDTTMHFQSLITEFYVAQSLGQKMALITSNPLVGNPSALFDSIAMGTRDFFVEPSRAKGSAEFIAGIGRGSSSLLTNTVGGIVGSLGEIPRAVAQGLETAVGDKEYLAARDSIRGRGRYAASPAQGLVTGAISLGHGIASGASGLVREPMTGAMENGAGGFLKGLGKGVVGGVLKPIAGALDLIGEPAVGFRSMMTSVASAAEPMRPARAFWGASANRLVSYDLHAALGQAVLESVGKVHETKSGQSPTPEELWAWVPLVAAYPGSSNHDLTAFLWAMRRRCAAGARFRSRNVLDCHGEPQRAENFRCGLVTPVRVIVASLVGHVIWERPLTSVVDTQVSLEYNDFLMIGVRPLGSPGGQHVGIPPVWERIACGSSARRDAFNSAIKKALDVYRGHLPDVGDATSSAIDWEIGSSAVIDTVELVDMTSTGNIANARATCSASTAADDKEALVGAIPCEHDETIAPSGMGNQLEKDADLDRNDSTAELCSHGSLLDTRMGSRSLQVSLQNDCEEGNLVVVNRSLRSGRWSRRPPEDEIGPGAVAHCRATGEGEDTCDVSGAISLFVDLAADEDSSSVDKEQSGLASSATGLITLCFMIPMMEKNEYAVTAPQHLTVTRIGGDFGDHADVVFRISNRSALHSAPLCSKR